jgi:hypothetical protein
MSTFSVSFILWVAGIYLGIGSVVGLVFVSFIPRSFDPDAASGSLGFRLAVLPGIIALWPLIFTRLLAAKRGKGSEGDAERPVSPERLRRQHGRAFLLLACVGPILFALALLWRVPRWEDVPPIDLPNRPSLQSATPAAQEGWDH